MTDLPETPTPRRCKACGVALPRQAGPGRPADYCLEHADRGNRSRKRARLARLQAGVAPEDAAALAGLAGPDDPAQLRALEALEPMRLAAALSITSDPQRAADLAGITIRDPAHLADIEARARSDHKDLTARKATAIGELITQAAIQQLLNLIARSSRMAPGQSAGAIKQLIQALELLTGGAQPTYSRLVISVAGPAGEDLLGDGARVDAAADGT